MNNVHELQKLNFSVLSIDKKIEIKSLGRPTPEFFLKQLEIKKKENRIFRRLLHSKEVYSKNEWICGCEVRKSFFCFPCLVFTPQPGIENLWTVKGVADIKHLSEKIKKHETSIYHMNRQVDLALLGKENILSSLDAQFRNHVNKHNAQVRKNRHVLKLLISCVKFCGTFELPLTGHDESESSINPGVYSGLVNLTGELDNAMRDHLESSTVFKGTSERIQNDILDCMLNVCREEIAQQIKSSDFVSIQCDETTDISNHCQMVLVSRYVFQGAVYERFWGFMNPKERTAESFKECIVDEIEPLLGKSREKLIALSYDGVNVITGSVGGVQAKIREEYPYAYFVHCYAHQINLIMEKATSHNAKVRIFFANLSSIPTFFSNSSHTSDFLETVVGARLSKVASILWNYNIRTVNVVYENRDKLEECFELIEEKALNNITINEAGSLKRTLQDPEFMFWLTVFHRILPHVDILYNQLQSRNGDSIELQTDIRMFQNHISKEREQLDELDRQIQEEFIEPIRKRKRNNNFSTRSADAKEVCDVVTTCVKDRFSFTGHLEAASLFHIPSFTRFSVDFPEQKLRGVTKLYPMLDKEKLRSELELLYRRQDLHIIGATKILWFLEENNLHSVFSECIKLLKIIITIPMTTAESERCFPTLSRVKTFLRNTMTTERLNALAMLSICKELVHEMKDFDERVMEKFISIEERRMDFLFKS